MAHWNLIRAESSILRAMTRTTNHPIATWALAREIISTTLHPQLGGISTAKPIVSTKGVRQGSPDSGYLYILAVADALTPLTNSWKDRGFGLRVGRNGETTNNLAFADDTLLVARNPQQAHIMFSELTAVLKRIGLLTNEDKTQYVSTFFPEATKYLPGKNMTREGMIVLGRAFALYDTTEKDLARKEGAAWHSYRRILPILRQHKPLKHRLRILQACVLQVILWGSETYTITKRRMAHLRGVHTRMAKGFIPCPGHFQGLQTGDRILEHTRHVRQLIKREGYQMLDYLWIARFWGWAGHVARLKIPNPVAYWISYHDVNWWREQQRNPKGRRHEGSAGNTSRWEDPIIRYTPLKHKWKSLAQNREDWKKMFGCFWENINTVIPQKCRPKSPALPRTYYVTQRTDSLQAVIAAPFENQPQATRGNRREGERSAPSKVISANSQQTAAGRSSREGTSSARSGDISASSHRNVASNPRREGGNTARASSSSSCPKVGDRQARGASEKGTSQSQNTGTAINRQRGRGPGPKRTPKL